MNESQAIKRFVKENFELLTSKDFRNQDFKRQRKAAFVEKHKKKFGIPNLSEICEALVIELQTKQYDHQKLINLIQTLPIFRNIGEPQLRKVTSIAESNKYKSAVSTEDLKVIREVGAFEAVSKHKGAELAEKARRKIGDLEKELETKRQEKGQLTKDVEDLKSVLDETHFEEPDIDEVEELEKTWWERFYLKKNPFAVKDGLSQIDKDLYEDVVLKTAPFRSLLNRFQKDRKVFFNTAFLLTGNFGFGKTTLFDYLEAQLFKNEIITIRVTSGRQHVTCSGYIDSFYQQLINRLQDEIQLTGSTLNLKNDDSEEYVVNLCKEILRLKNGIVIFLDDYHKHVAQVSSVLDFLGTLQILKDRLTRAEMNVGFIVSGLPDWEEKRRTYTQMGGFLDGHTICMPEVTSESVADVFNKRLAAYCYDTQPATLSEHWISTVFDRIGSSLSYRDYLNEIIGQLDQDNYAIVNTPLALDEDKLNSIKNTFEANSVAKAAINKLINESHFKRFTKQQVRKCLEVFVQIGLRQGVTEIDPLFAENKHYFQLLKERTLIQKQKFTTTNSKRDMKWIIHKTIQQTIDEIQTKYKRSLSDYFLKIYGDTTSSTPVRIAAQAEHPKPLATILTHDIARAAKEKLELAQQYYESLVLDAEIKPEQRKRSIDRLDKAFESLLTAFFIIDGSSAFFERSKIKEPRSQINLHWLDTETIIESFRRRDEYGSDSSKVNFEKTLKSTKESFNYVADKLEELLKDIAETNRPMPFRFRSIRHSPKENDLLERIQKDYYSADAKKHFNYVEDITDHLEDRFRAFFYLCTNLAYGEDYFEHVDSDSKRYAFKNMHSRTQFSTFVNNYDGLTRSQFRSLFTAGLVKEQIINPCLELEWLTADWELFLSLFSEENIKTSHKLHAAFSVEQRDRYIKYCVLAEKLLAELNQAIGNIIDKNSFIVADNKSSAKQLENCIFRFGFRLKPNARQTNQPKVLNFEKSDIFQKQHTLADHELEKPSYDNFKNYVMYKLDNSDHFEEDLLDLNYLRDHYDLPISELMCCFAFAKHVDKVIEINPWFGSSVIISKRRS